MSAQQIQQEQGRTSITGNAFQQMVETGKNVVNNFQSSKEEQITDEYPEAHFNALLNCVQMIKEPADENEQMFFVEVIRNVSEYIIFSERYGRTYFDSFCEKNILQSFSRILQLNNRNINMQLIQTMSIFLSNISAPTKRFYILSHPFLNQIIQFDFNFFDEELVDIFVMFLKTLALQINNETIHCFFNSRYNHFPLIAVTMKFYNHPEMMVRNAVRIIMLTIFKMNNPQINKLFTDLPFVSFFAHLSCFLRDKITEMDQCYNTFYLDQSSSKTGAMKPVFQIAKKVMYDKLESAVDDLYDQLELLCEIFDTCQDNETICKQLMNALLHYCYLPLIMGSLLIEYPPMPRNSISVSTALFVLTNTFKQIQYQPLIDSLACLLMHDWVPVSFQTHMEQFPLKVPVVSYRQKWMVRLPVHYSKVKFLQEFYNENCFENFLEDPKYAENVTKSMVSQLPNVQQELRYGSAQDRQKYMKQIYREVVMSNLQQDEVTQIEDYHQQLSNCFGSPLGILNTKFKQMSDSKSKDQFACLYSDYYRMMLNVLQKEHDMENSVYFTKNQYKHRILQLLETKDDNLTLQIVGCLYVLVSSAKVSQALLYHSKMYPIGASMKGMLLQRLLAQPQEQQIQKLQPTSFDSLPDLEEEVKEQQSQPSTQAPVDAIDSNTSMVSEQVSKSPKQMKRTSTLSSLLGKKPEEKKVSIQETIKQLEGEFQNFLFEQCQRSNKIYDTGLLQALLESLSVEKPYRQITFKLICLLSSHLSFNKKLDCSLAQDEKMILKKAYQSQIETLQAYLQDPSEAERCARTIDEEFSKFRFVDQAQEFDQVLGNPIILLSQVDEKRRVPAALQYVTKSSDMLKVQVRIFFGLRYLTHQLTLYNNQINKTLRENPLRQTAQKNAKSNMTPEELISLKIINEWAEGENQIITQGQLEIILCNVRLSQKMQVRYAIIHSDHFILVENERSTNSDQLTFMIHKKVPLTHVGSMIDRSEPRNLILSFSKQDPHTSKIDYEDLLLYFESSFKCTFVKNKIDQMKNTQRKKLIKNTDNFLEQCQKILQQF